MHRRLMLVGPVATAPLVGCLQLDGWVGTLEQRRLTTVPADRSDTDRSAAEFWMVWVHGDQTREEAPGAVCTWARTHEVRPAASAIRYAEDACGFDPAAVAVLVAVDHHDHSQGCPVEHALVANPDGPVTLDLGGGGELAVEVHANGTVQVAERRARLGRGVQATYETVDGLEGQVRVANPGAWHTSHLEPR